MIVLIDAGNSRVKMALLDNTGDLTGFAAVASIASDPDLIGLRGALATRLEGADRIVVANVAGTPFAVALGEICAAAGAPQPEFLVAGRRLAGVVNGYAKASQLGVDRWLAIVAAYDLHRSEICVIDAGSALTIDAVGADGRHLGGCIAPGLDMMRAALWRETSDLAELSRDGGGEPRFFADSTRAAIGSGCRHAVTGLIHAAIAEMTARSGSRPSIVLTGGNAPDLASTIGDPVRHIPDLVLRGAALAAMENA